MLVLSRKSQEEIIIGNGVTIKVLDLRHGRVRLGICAPRSLRIERGEVAGIPATTFLRESREIAQCVSAGCRD